MTKIDWSKYPPVPGFDSVKMKREIQAKIYEETKHMTREEKREHTRQASERFWADIERRRTELAAESQS